MKLWKWLVKDWDELNTFFAALALAVCVIAILILLLPPLPANVAYEVTPSP